MNNVRQRKISKLSIYKSRKLILTDDKVCQHLICNPDFFIRHAKQLDNLQITHPVRGGISLPEWQMTRQRRKIKELEQKIQSLLKNAAENEILFDQLMSLQLTLFKANNFDELTDSLNQWARMLGLQRAYLYLFESKWQIPSTSKYRHLSISTKKFDSIRIRHLQHSPHYLGQLSRSEMAFLVPDRKYWGSVAISLLGQLGDLGLLVFASRDPNHYQHGQGTLLLEKIGLLLPIFINRWLIKNENND